jgi:hypothetical protein
MERKIIGTNVEGEFSEQILADLVDQGLSGQELITSFKEMSKKIAPAMEKLINEADSIARGEKNGAKMNDIFELEDK